MRFLEFCYNSIIGRFFLKLFTRPWFSKLVGGFLDSPMSKCLIKGFVKRNEIKLDEYVDTNFSCFNDCFTRKMKPGLRPSEDGLVAPADSFLRAIKIEDGTLFEVKNSLYNVADLLEDERLASEYLGATCLIFRLSTEHYHRYSYPASGRQDSSKAIKGVLHTVQPFGQAHYPVFVRNSREYSILHTEGFGDVLMMEVGALLVGKIVNYMESGSFTKGEEKGYFKYGGSTVILLVKEGKVKVEDKYFDGEVEVKMGQKIGE